MGSEPRSGRLRHVLSALVQNQPGVLAQVSGMLASRGFNIDSLAVGETEDPESSRITFVVQGDDRVLDQVRKQLEKIVPVVRVIDISREDFVERDLMLIKVDAPHGRRAEILQGLVQIFRGRIVDVGADQMMVEISGQEKKIEAFIDADPSLRNPGTGQDRPDRHGPQASSTTRKRPPSRRRTRPKPQQSSGIRAFDAPIDAR